LVELEKAGFFREVVMDRMIILIMFPEKEWVMMRNKFELAQDLTQ
jgi:hypothetical protein